MTAEFKTQLLQAVLNDLAILRSILCKIVWQFNGIYMNTTEI